MKIHRIQLCSFVFALMMTGCSDTQFGGASSQAKRPAASDQTGTAQDTASPGSAETALPGEPEDSESAGSPPQTDPDATIVQVPCDADTFAIPLDHGPVSAQGTICLPPAPPSRIVFVVDLSGTMADNDPEIDGSCGRRDAVAALADKLAQRVASIDVVAFSTSAEVLATDIDATDVKQDSTLASRLCAAEGETDYAAGIKAATALADDANTLPAIYLLSDGLPDRFGVDARSQGLAAADALRQRHPTAILNAIYLGSQQSGSKARGYLSQLTGDPERVALVGKAADLTEGVIGLELPNTYDTKNTMAQMANGGVTFDIALVSITPSLDRPGTWDFVTDSFTIPDQMRQPGTTFRLVHQATGLLQEFPANSVENKHSNLSRG